AIENGMSPYKKFDSSPATIRLSKDDVWKVNNYTEGSGGPPMAIRDALVRSVNTVFARLIMDVTPQKVADLAMRMGISVPIAPHPAIALGGFTNGPSALDMATGYATIANSGQYNPPTAIVSVTDSARTTIAKYVPKPKRVLSEGTAYITTDVLQDVIKRGTGTRAKIGRPAAGKTGTAQEYHDAWFCGFTPDLAAAVWVGYPDDFKSMYNVHGVKVAGGTFPAMIWGKFMSNALKDKKPIAFAKPKADVVEVRICVETGLLANEFCPDVEFKPFQKKKVPKKTCKVHANPAMANVPEVIGITQAEAIKTLDQMHFKSRIVFEADTPAPRGNVIDQEPPPYLRQRQGSIVTIVVSGGTGKTIKVPNVVGLTEAQASSFLSQSELKMVDVTASPYIPNPEKDGRVVYQSPIAGSDMQGGQVVTVYINRKE
ncbi:MAG: PASTA domain-containing protein, partial [Rubrobacteridae bacterium]|nr:PASTA domain-containing protein [Rubrobacteridae bacterium]